MSPNRSDATVAMVQNESNNFPDTLLDHNSTSSIAVWSFGSAYYLLVFFAVVSTNIPVLLTYIRSTDLRSNTFSIYLMNLLVANLFHAFVEHPLDVILALFSGQKHSQQFCSAQVYAVYVTGGIMLNTHFLITLNRIWALTFPVLYRHHHSKGTAVFLCISVWFYVHLIVVPGLVVDAMFYRENGDNVYCLINTASSKSQTSWHQLVNVLVFIIPTISIAFAYPFIWWKRKQRDRSRVADVTAALGGASQGRYVMARQPGASKGPSGGGSTKPTDKAEPQVQRAKRSHSFLVLTLLTTSVVICWAPVTTFFALSVFGVATITTLYNITYIWWVLQPVVDPILFTVALKDLRLALKKFLCCR